MAIGYYKREFPRIVVLRGWDPQNPTTFTIALPVGKLANGNPDTIHSGMVITPAADGKSWVKGAAAGATPSIVALAQDDSYDFDVVAANKLVGLSCSGKFRIGTPFFVRSLASTSNAVTGTAQAYGMGTKVTYAKDGEFSVKTIRVSGVDTPVTVPANGYVRVAKTGEPVIGVVPQQFEGRNAAVAADTLAAGTAGAWALQQSIGTAEDSSSVAENAYFVVFDTTFSPVA